MASCHLIYLSNKPFFRKSTLFALVNSLIEAYICPNFGALATQRAWAEVTYKQTDKQTNRQTTITPRAHVPITFRKNTQRMDFPHRIQRAKPDVFHKRTNSLCFLLESNIINYCNPHARAPRVNNMYLDQSLAN